MMNHDPTHALALMRSLILARKLDLHRARWGERGGRRDPKPSNPKP